MVKKTLHLKYLILLLLFATCTPCIAGAAESAPGVPVSSYKADSPIDAKVEKSINLILSLNAKDKKMPAIDEIAPLLDYMIAADGKGRSPHPEKRTEGAGIYWKRVLDKPLKESLRYFYNPNIAYELLYPAAIRRGYWLEGSQFLTMKMPLWDLINEAGSTPITIRGREYEEITPDDFSGSYYIYTQDRLIMVFKYNDMPMVVSMAWQDGKSETGKKGGFVAPYNNWDFIFTKEEGGTATGLGWMSTYMYASSSITLMYPEGNKTGYAMFKWLKAGWSGMNVVKRSHIESGANRNFVGMLDVIAGNNHLSVEALEEINTTANAYTREQMIQISAPYFKALSEESKKDDILKRSEFQKLVKGGGYAQHLNDDELRSLVKLNMLKRKLGKPVLGE